MEELNKKPKFYKIVRYCKLCNKRFFLYSLRNGHFYCDECHKKQEKCRNF